MTASPEQPKPASKPSKYGPSAHARDRHLLESFFERSPIAHWVEDFSALMPWLDLLRSSGVSDLRSYLDDNPEQVRHGINLIRIVDVNPAGLKLIGAARKADVLGEEFGQSASEESESAFIEQIVAAWEGRTSFRTVGAGRSLDGGRIDYILTWVAVVNDGPQLSTVIVSIEDMTEINEAQRQIARLAETNDRFVASITHELRTPLTGVMGFAELLREQSDIPATEAIEYTEFLASAAAAGGAVLDNLLLATELNPEGTGFEEPIHLATTSIDLPTEAHAAVASLPPGAKEQVVVTGDPIAAQADSTRVRQIIRNLLANAVDHGGDQITLVTHDSNALAQVEVIDNGDGLPPQAIDRAFELYAGSYEDPGLTKNLGIGLTVSRALAREMGGDLRYERTGGVTTFALFLPRAEDDCA